MPSNSPVKNANGMSGRTVGKSQAHGAHKSKGQRVSKERGRATRNKKNPGKRASQGGS